MAAAPSISTTALANRALGALGQNLRLTSFEDDTSVEADICRAHFWDAWLEELVAYPWNRATRRVALLALDEAPAFEFAHQYQLPADCLKVQSLYDAGERDPWRVETYYPGGDPAQVSSVVVCDIGSPLRVIYTPDVRDLARVGPAFRGAFVLRLTAHIAGPITRDNAITVRALEIYEKSAPALKLADAQEAGVERPPEGDWVRARSAAGGWDYSSVRGV
jgi:hypothetical protein